MDQSLEEWRPVVGYEGLYEVSSLGRVKSLPRSCPAGHGSYRRVPGKIMSQSPDGNGYLAVILSKNSSRKTTRVCRVVAAAFIGPRPDGLVIAHGSNGKLCDEASNLSYKTQAGNMADKLRDDTHTRGERNSRSRLTEAQVRFARAVVTRKLVSCACLGRAWGVSASTVSKVVLRKNWSWLDA
jgi:hypothetical protein